MEAPGFDESEAYLALGLKIPEISCLKALRHFLTTPSASLINLHSAYP